MNINNVGAWRARDRSPCLSSVGSCRLVRQPVNPNIYGIDKDFIAVTRCGSNGARRSQEIKTKTGVVMVRRKRTNTGALQSSKRAPVSAGIIRRGDIEAMISLLPTRSQGMCFNIVVSGLVRSDDDHLGFRKAFSQKDIPMVAEVMDLVYAWMRDHSEPTDPDQAPK